MKGSKDPGALLRRLESEFAEAWNFHLISRTRWLKGRLASGSTVELRAS